MYLEPLYFYVFNTQVILLCCQPSLFGFLVGPKLSISFILDRAVCSCSLLCYSNLVLCGTT